MRIFAGGRHVATLEKHVGTKELVSQNPPFKARLYDFESLLLSHTGTILRLQGSNELFGHTIVVIRGKPRPVWHPQPGISDVRVLLPLENPAGLTANQMFNLAIELRY